MSSYLSLPILVLCYVLALASIPLSFYIVKRKIEKVKYFRLLSSYVMASTLAYAVWLLLFRTGDVILDLSPLPLNLVAILTPWILLIKRKYVS